MSSEVSRSSPFEALATAYTPVGSLTLKDDSTGRIYDLKEGSIVWIPKGVKLSIVKSEGARFVYVEQRQGEPTVGGTGE